MADTQEFLSAIANMGLIGHLITSDCQPQHTVTVKHCLHQQCGDDSLLRQMLLMSAAFAALRQPSVSVFIDTFKFECKVPCWVPCIPFGLDLLQTRALLHLCRSLR